MPGRSACTHASPAPVGQTQAPVEGADAAVAGLVLVARVGFCVDCSELVASVHLRPKARDATAVLTTEGFTSLVSAPAVARQPGQAVRHG